MAYVVGAEYWYLSVLSPGSFGDFDKEAADIASLRAAMEATGPVWAALLESDLDPTAILVAHGEDGIDSAAPLTIRLAQVVHHGTDHRSQVCTALTTLAIEPPEIDVWAYAWKDGRLVDTPTGG